MAFFSKNDKEPSWDGFINAYNHAGDNHSKSDSAGRVPVQIKGCSCTDIKTIKKSYSVEIADIRAYLQEGGTIYFVVFITEEEEIVYYHSFLPYELRRILKEYGNQKSRTVQLELLPTEKKEITDLILNFLRDRDKQRAAISSEIVTLEDLAKKGLLQTVSFGYTTINKSEYQLPLDYFFEHDMYLYADLPLGISLPIEHIQRIEMACTDLPYQVLVGDRLFYNQYKVVYTKEQHELHFGKSLIFINHKESLTGRWNYTLAGTLKERIIDEDFIISALQEKSIIINGHSVPLFNVSQEDIRRFDIESHKEHLAFLRRAQAVLDEMHVSKDLNCDTMNDKDIRNLNRLVSAVADKNLVMLNDTGQVFGKYNIANINLLVCAIKDKESGLFRMYDYLNAPLKYRGVDSNGNEFDSSVCLAIERNAFVSFDNIDYDSIIEDLRSVPCSEAYSEQLTFLLLDMLNIYDGLMLPTHPLLNFAKKLMDLIKTKYPGKEGDINLLNSLQIVRRERELSNEEIGLLKSVVDNPLNKSNHRILTGALILLNNQREAMAQYSLMNEDEKNAFDKYPICKFRKW